MRFEHVVGCRCLQKRRNTRVNASYFEQKQPSRLRRNKELLKKTLIVLMPVLFLLFVVVATSPNLDRAWPSNKAEPSRGNISPSTNSEVTQPNASKRETRDVKATDSSQEPKPNAANNQPSETEPENGPATNQSTVISDPSSQSPGLSSQDKDPANATPLPLPDGRIYLGAGAPYAYVPTCTNKGASRMPIAPPEPEG